MLKAKGRLKQKFLSQFLSLSLSLSKSKSKSIYLYIYIYREREREKLREREEIDEAKIFIENSELEINRERYQK